MNYDRINKGSSEEAGPVNSEKPGSGQTGCRCEESTRMNLWEILKTVLQDLMFWRKKR